MTVRMNSDFYYEEATWLEAQAHIGAEDTERAKKMLDGIVEKGGVYKEQAIALRESME